MTNIKISLLLLTTLPLLGCEFLKTYDKPVGTTVKAVNSHSQEYQKYNKAAPKMKSVPNVRKENKVYTKRINTTECQDSDDWYLDGYRVGKSFKTQKQEMLQQRASYCGYTLKSLPTKFKANWERGFNIGKK